MRLLRLTAACITIFTLAACSHSEDPTTVDAQSAVQDGLAALPGPTAKVNVAVYGYEDLTGQFKETSAQQTLSRAVSQGGASILIEKLQEAGGGKWFTIVERNKLANLLQERQIIREMYQRHQGRQPSSQELPAVTFAGIIIEGGIIGYDTNTVTGGLGARFLGIGASRQYKEDTITVYLRAVSVKTGEILMSVKASKQVASVSNRADVFRFVAFQKLLEAEVGVTRNEPALIALRMAIDKGVQSLILEGARKKYWAFADQTAGDALIREYLEERGYDEGYISRAIKTGGRRSSADSSKALALRTAPDMKPSEVKQIWKSLDGAIASAPTAGGR